MAYVYLRTDGGNLFTVGHFDPSGKWHPDNDFSNREEAASRCAWLNGSAGRDPDRYGTPMQRAVARDVEGAAELLAEAADLVPRMSEQHPIAPRLAQWWRDVQSFRHNKGH